MVKTNIIFRSLLESRLYNIAREMGQNMVRTSISRIFQEARDLSTSIHNPQGDIVTQIPYIPVLAGTPYFAVRSIINFFSDEIYEGDIFILGDPFYGNNHQPDITVLKPVFFRKKLKFWVVSKGHHADIGGSSVVAYNPGASTIWEEGIRITPARLFREGRLNREVWDLILSNVKMEKIVKYDLNCQIGAVKIGEKRLFELLEKYGEKKIQKGVNDIIANSERFTEKKIEEIPEGEFSGERVIDIRNTPEHELSGRSEVKIAVETIVSEDRIIFDFRGSDRQVRAFINSPYVNTYASSLASFCFIINPGPSINQGIMNPVNVKAPGGTVVNPEQPYPSVASTVDTSSAIIEAIWLSLSRVIPEKVSACWARWCAPTTSGYNSISGKRFSEVHFLSKGGGGAVEGMDGWSHIGLVICGGGLSSPDPEFYERATPFLLLQHEYLPDSAGAGKWRGGLGVVYRWKVMADEVRMAMFGDGCLESTRPFGIRGGGPSSPNVVRILRADGKMEYIYPKGVYTLKKDDIVEIFSSGGGGYGNPFERDPEKVLEDVVNGLVSLDSAERDYGVVIDPDTLEINWQKTTRIRRYYNK